MTKTSVSFTLFAAALSALSCSSATDKSSLQLGALVSQTGTLAGIGPSIQQGVQLATDDINASGGVMGRPLSFKFVDDMSSTSGATAGAQTLVAAGVPFILGAIGSADTLAASAVTIAAGVVLMSPSSTSASITDANDNDLLFRTCPSDALQAKLLAQRALAAGHTQFAVVYLDDAYGQPLSATFVSEVTAGGGTVQQNQAYTPGQASYVNLWQTVLAGHPDAVLMVAYSDDAGQMIKDYNSYFSSENVFFYFPDALALDSFVELAGGASAFSNLQHEGTVPNGVGPYASQFNSAFEAKFSVTSVPSYAANAYDAVYVAALAIARAGAATGDAIAANLRKNSVSTATVYGPPNYAAAVAAIKANAAIDLQGASGPLNFDSNGDVGGTYAVWKVVNGAITYPVASVQPQ